MADPRTWDGLIEALNTWSEAREVADGIEVTFQTSPGTHRTVEVVMTPHDWEELAGTISGETADTLRERILRLPGDMPFLVCETDFSLIPSATRELPGDPTESYQPEAGGGWFTPEGEAFADWPDRL